MCLRLDLRLRRDLCLLHTGQGDNRSFFLPSLSDSHPTPCPAAPFPPLLPPTRTLLVRVTLLAALGPELTDKESLSGARCAFPAAPLAMAHPAPHPCPPSPTPAPSSSPDLPNQKSTCS